MRVRDQKKPYKENREGSNLCSALIRLSSLALSQANPERIISQTLKEIRKIFNAKLCWISLVEDNKVNLKSLGDTKGRKNLIKSQLLPKLSPEILKRTYPLICNRISELYKNNRVLYRILHGRNIHKFMGVPLRKDGKLIGVLNVARDSDSPSFTKEDLKSLALLGTIVVMTKLKSTEEESKQSQDFLKAIIDNIPNPIFIKDRKHRWVVLNKALSDLVEYPREKMLGKSDYDFFPKNQADFFWKKDEEMFRTGKVIDIPEEPITDKEGKIHYMHTKKAPLRDSSRRITHLVGIIEDITERKRAERALRESEERYRLLVENIKEGIYSTHKGVFTSVNESMSKMFGYSKKELIGMPSWNLAVPEIRNSVKDLFFEKAAKKDYSPIEVKCIRKDGSVFIAEVRLSRISEKQQFLGIVSDITERKLAEESLKQKVLELNSFINNIPDMAWLKDAESRFIALNKAFGDAIRMKPETLIGQTCEACFGIEAAKKFREDDLKVMKGREQVSIEEKILDSKGNELWLETVKSPIFDESGKVVGTVGIARNVTERKRAEEALVQNERIARERARLLTDLRSLDEIDDILARVCQAIRDSGLFERAVMTLHDQVRQIVYLGQVGLPPDVVERARQASPVDRKSRARITSKKFRISDSFFIPAEAGVDFSKTGRYIPQKKRNSVGGDWQPGDELFVPLRDFSRKIMGFLSVDTPTDGCRPDVKTIEALEMMVEAASSRVREVEAHEALKRERDFSQSIIGTANSMIVCLDANAKITVFNQECEQITGYRREEVLGKRWPELFLPPDHHHFKLKSFANWVRAHPRDRYEGPILTKSGEIRTILWSNTAILGSGKKDITAIAIGHDITERKRAEEALQISQERYELSTKAANVGVWDWDIKTNKFYIDPTVKEILGYKDEEIPNDIEVWMTYVHPDDREPVMAAAQTCLDGKTPEYVFEHRMVHRDGSVRWILSRGNVMRDAKGNAVRMAGTDTDITERKQAEEALQVSENKYRTLLENLPQKIFLKDRTSVYVSCNESYARDLKIKSDEIAGKTDYDFFPKELAEKYRADDKRIMELGKTEDIEERYIQEGQEVFVYTVKTPVNDEQGNLIGLLGIFWDITERKRAEEALRKSEGKYRTLVETAQEGIGISDPEENLIFVNQAFADLLGYQKEKLLGKNLKEISDETQYSIFRRETEKRKKGGFSKYEAKLLTKSGKLKYVYISAAPLFDEDGSFAGTLGVLSDLTEIKKAREYNILLNTSRALSRTLKFDQVLKTGVEKTIQVLNADRCGVVLLTEGDPVGSKITVQVFPQKMEALAPVFDLRVTKELLSSYRRSLQKQKYIQVFDARSNSVPELGRKILRKAKIASALIIPMFVGKKMRGIVHVGTAKKTKPFGTEVVRLALTMVNQVAVALENCRLMEDLKKEHSLITEQADALKRQTREKDILLKVSRALSKTMDLNEIGKAASRVVGSAMGVERCAVTLATPDGNQLEIKGLCSKEGTDSRKLIGRKFSWGDIPDLTGAIKKGKPFVISDTSDLPSKSKTKEYFLNVGIKSVLGAGMFFGKKLVGMLSITSIKEHKTFSNEEIKLVQTMANQIAVAIENARLLQVVKKHTQDLKNLSAQLMKVQENERKRIAQELHDEVGQMLQSMKMNLDRIKRNLSSKPQKLEGIEDWLLDTENLLSETIDDIRTLTFDLRPSMLDDFGLIPTLRWYIENYSRRSNIKIFLKAKDQKYRLPLDIEVTLYRIIQEALTNVSKHAHATEVTILVSKKNSTVILSVRDNGVGFDTNKVLSAPKGMGLLNIKERVNLLGGSFEIISRPRKGTTININIPFSEVKHEEGQITGS